MSAKKILLIDGHGIAFRAFYAVPQLSAPDGTPTNAVVGFLKMLERVRHDQNPDEIYTAFDMKAPTFRHLLYPDYKGTRKPTPEEFKPQIPLLRELLPLLGIRLLQRQTVEADDLLGSAAVQFAARGDQIVILTSDKDIMQVLRPGVKIIRPVKGVSSFNEYTPESFTAEYGFAPEGMVDYLALMGDSSDNIPGLPGVGEKTASKLLHEYGSIEDIAAHIDELKPAMKKKFADGGAKAIDNRKLTRLKCDEDLSEFVDAAPQTDIAAFAAKCEQLGLKKVVAALLPPEAEESVPEPVVEIVAPVGAIPLETILEAPRLALDVDEKADEKVYQITLEHLRECRAILATPDGSYWQGTLADLAPHTTALCSDKVLCFDAKALCSLMEHPQISGLWDLKTAWYLLHPDLKIYDPVKELGLKFSPERTMRLFDTTRTLSKQIDKLGMTGVMSDIDLPLIPVLVGMERRGIRLDRPKMLTLADELNLRLSDISKSIWESAGREINLNSPKQVGELLFETLGLPCGKKTKTSYSTNVSVLEHLRDFCGERCDVPAKLLEYRELQKMSSGFVQPLLSAAGSDGLIHSTFEALTTGTGRLSSRDPNMQNLPAYSGWGTRIRECLIPNGEGNCFAAADYSQIELRVLAHLSGDPQLIEIFNSDRDIHTETAALVFGLPPEAITKELRRSAKTVSFGLIYGMNEFGLAQRLDCDRSSAVKIRDAYFAALPGVREYIESSKRKSLSDGYTTTLFGRRRLMDELSTGTDKNHQNRVAVNSPIQGTAADITKIAMIKVAEHFAGHGVEMVLQVHDSIVCECPADRAEETAHELGEVMQNAVKLSIPLKTEQTTGKTLATV